MLIAIANNYGIHIISHYYEFTKIDQNLSRIEILKRTMKRLGMPIFLAGITTVISFMSLMTHELSKVREIGLLVSFGIAVSFFLSLFLIPAILILVPRPTYLGKNNSLESVNNFLVNWGKFFVKNRVPFLSSLPWIGKKFFTSTSEVERTTDLIIQITPRIVIDTYSGIVKTDKHIIEEEGSENDEE